jgi:hypothetical protein
MDESAFERHYRIGELAKLWGLGRESERKLVMREPDVVKLRLGRKSPTSHIPYRNLRRGGFTPAF